MYALNADEERIVKPRSKNTKSWHPFCYARRLWRNCEQSETPTATLSSSESASTDI